MSIPNTNAHKRPRSVTLFTWGVLILAALYLTRIFVTLREWDFLQEYALPGTGGYLLGSGLLWSGLLFPWVVGLWRGAPVAYRLLVPLSAAYTLWMWVERLYLHWKSAPVNNHPFWLGTTLLFWGWLLWWRNRPPIKAFFGVLHE